MCGTPTMVKHVLSKVFWVESWILGTSVNGGIIVTDIRFKTGEAKDEAIHIQYYPYSTSWKIETRMA